MKHKSITLLLILITMVCCIPAVQFVREKRITNLVVSRPWLNGTVIAADDSTVTLAADVWWNLYETVRFDGDTLTFDRSAVLYPDGDMNPDDLSVGNEVALVVEGRPIGDGELAFERIYMIVDYLKHRN